LSDTIYKYASILENEYSDDNLNLFLESLKKKIPNEDWFTSLFYNVGYSKRGLNSDNKLKDVVRAVLTLHEQYLEKADVSREFTIEHIFPDSDSDDNSRIGNLLPLEESLNKVCDNKPLAEKLAIYKRSSFLTVKKFVERYDGKAEAFNVKDRTYHLAKKFYNEILKLPAPSVNAP
jgi:hypothetical protein